MGETTTGIRAMLSSPLVYEIWSRALGRSGGREDLVEEYVRPAPGQRVLDVGCGPGNQLPFLGDVVYVGVDFSEAYIERAKERWGARGEFRVGDATALDEDLRDFDIAIAFGVLHHIDDDGVRAMLAGIAGALKPGGHLMTIDPTFAPGQSRAARAVVSRDRGQHVRPPRGYAALAREAFGEVDTTVRGDLLRIPYSHCILECRRPDAGRAA